jgi:hypothetical protein
MVIGYTLLGFFPFMALFGNPRGRPWPSRWRLRSDVQDGREDVSFVDGRERIKLGQSQLSNRLLK